MIFRGLPVVQAASLRTRARSNSVVVAKAPQELAQLPYGTLLTGTARRLQSRETALQATCFRRLGSEALRGSRNYEPLPFVRDAGIGSTWVAAAPSAKEREGLIVRFSGGVGLAVAF